MMYKKTSSRIGHFLTGLAVCLPFLCACSDDYVYDDKEPDWLGENIYDYLKKEGHYTYYLSLINELGYETTLSRTGCKTLFPANDEAFEQYFKAHGMAVNSPKDIAGLTASQKRYLFNSSMLNMTYLDKMLANVSSGDNKSGEGVALRKASSVSYLDSIRFVPSEELPKTTFWTRFQDYEGAYLADNVSRMNVNLTPQYFQTSGLSTDDWTIMTRGQEMPYEAQGFYVNAARVAPEHKNITCKNGYIHFIDKVVTPLPNMAEVIETTPQVSLFAELLDKFCAPYYQAGVDQTARNFYPEGTFKDTIYVRRFFNENNCIVDPTGRLDLVNNYGVLFYDPSDNGWSSQEDMGVMFVPNNEAMLTYWDSPQGKFLKDVYGTWQNVPTDVLSAFIKNHQRRSFRSSLPHDWKIMTDESSFYMNMKEADVLNTQFACNGIVYQTNKVYPPIDYQCVYGPSLTAGCTKMMKNAIKDDDLKFYLYLRSMENQYNLLIPTDSAMATYYDPISWAIWANTGVDKREIWSFRLIGGLFCADIYSVNEDGTKGAFQKTIGGKTDADGRTKIENRLNDILDMHIVVADNVKEPLSDFMDSGRMQYGLTKSGTILKVSGQKADMKVQGGGDVELNLPAAQVAELSTGAALYNTDNGHTFFMDRILQDPFSSVYATMQKNADFDAFFRLLLGESSVYSYFKEDKEIEPIFDLGVTSNSSGIGNVVTSFNNYRYTLLIPTKKALDEAFAADPDLWTWEKIDNESDPKLKKKHCLYLLNFLRYHFIDGILPIAGVPFGEKEYETAARDKDNHFVRLLVSSTGDNLTFRDERGNGDASVLTQDEKDYNLLTRDYIVNNADYRIATQILASSRAVLHLVDHALNYQK